MSMSKQAREVIQKNRMRDRATLAVSDNPLDYPLAEKYVKYNDRGMAYLPSDAPLTREEFESIKKHGYINYILDPAPSSDSIPVSNLSSSIESKDDFIINAIGHADIPPGGLTQEEIKSIKKHGYINYTVLP